jgi:glycosyltransferase involved in cell wall biosynthesis
MRGWPKWRRLVHHSLELPTAYYKGGLRKQIHKVIMRYGMAQIDDLIIQDDLRFGLATRVIPGLAKRPHYLVPNSYISAIEPMASSLPWFDRIRSKNRWLVLYIGALERWTLPLTLLKELAEYRDAAFVLSGWCRDGSISEIRDLCASRDHVVIDLGIKPRSELNYMVANSDIGLAYYATDVDENINYIGLSSGKIHKYLSFGKPILVNRLPLLAESVEGCGLGVILELGSIKDGLNALMSRYAEHRQNVQKKYADTYAFEPAYQKFLAELCPQTDSRAACGRAALLSSRQTRV